ncbi:putative nuclease HARBI1 isoform X2 [Cydia pomonella]|uniref:putative nuclease HARBI1 isoform X2 n=1 Tax=Cydia pomonella TaxID=82600 RepID=UPI002ADDCE0F|nr:putative nuclease HARBI1 isoform X2 [Cydia pomonella]
MVTADTAVKAPVFWMSAETLEFVYQLLAPGLRRQCYGMPMVDARLQIMVAIHKLTSSNTYRDASATFDMNKSTGYNCTNRVINLLHSLAPGFIQWPSIAQAKAIAKDFEAVAGFPGIVGNVGCCRLRKLDCLDREAKDDVILQVICDTKKRIIHCNIAPTGTDYQSVLTQYLNDQKLPKHTHSIANNTYSLQENLMVSYQENNHKIFNEKIRSSFVIPYCLGSLLGRFESLNRGLTLNEKSNQRHINACCVLHNICILKGDIWSANGVAWEMKETSGACPKGVRKRDDIASQLSMG